MPTRPSPRTVPVAASAAAAFRRWLPIAIGLGALGSRPALAQGVTPLDDKEAARFAEARAVATGSALADPAVTWHGAGEWEGLFLVEATRGGERVRALVVAPVQGARKALVLDQTERASRLSVEVQRLAGAPGVVDLAITREPFQLESTVVRTTHHLLQLERVPRLLCRVEGTSSSTTAKGPVTWSSRREVILTAVERKRAPAAVRATATEVTEQRPHALGPGAAAPEPTRTAASPVITTYELAADASGACLPVK